MRPVVGSPVVMITTISATVIIVARWPSPEFLILFLDIGNQVFAELFGLGDHIWVRSAMSIKSIRQIKAERWFCSGYIRDMKKHGFIAFMVSRCFKVARASAFDLNTASSFLLDMLHIGTAVADDLSTEVEAMNRLKVDGNLLLGPFPL